MLAELKHTAKSWFGRRDSERVMDCELRYHVDQLEAQNMREGMSQPEARRRALVELGGIDQVKEECRDQWGIRLLDDLRQDLRLAFRGLRKHWGYTLAAVSTLALGLGANTALFSVLHGVVLRSLPVRDQDRVVVLRQQNVATGANRVAFSYLEMQAFREQNHTLDALVEYHNMRFTLLGRNEPETVETGVVSADFFDQLGIQPLYGRIFRPGEDHAGAEPVLVLSYRYFQGSYAGNPDIVGKTVRMNDRMHTVVGVLPPLPDYPDRIDVYMPSSSCPTRASQQFMSNPRARLLTLIARLKPGIKAETAQADLLAISKRLHQQFPDAYPKPRGLNVYGTGLTEELTREAKPAVLLLFSATGLVLLIACANVANLSIARAARRAREMAIRGALGANRWRLFRQLSVEGVVVALAAGALGLGLAYVTRDVLVSFASRFSARADEITIDVPVLLFALGVAVVTGVFFCALPAWRTPVDIASATKEGGAASTVGKAKVRMRGLLIGSQVAISFVLMIAAGLLMRSLFRLLSVDAGYRAENTIVMTVSPNWSRTTTTDQFRAIFENLLEKVRTTPGVLSAAIGSRVPLNQRLPNSLNFLAEGQPDDGPKPLLDLSVASPGYFDTLRVPILSGRDFTALDRQDAPPVALVNQSMARHTWAGRDPIGRRISLDSGRHWITVIGVVGDVRQYSLEREATDQMYVAFAQQPAAINVVIRAAMDPMSMSNQFRRALHEIDPEQPITEMRTLEQIRTEKLAAPRLLTTLFGLFATLTMLITAAGIGGVVAIAVRQRRSEIGIRIALGASPIRVVGMILSDEMRAVVIGLVAGAITALLVSRALSTFLYHIQPTDPITFTATASLLLACSIIACLAPAGGAGRTDPVPLLRGE